jgi:hypothetical protein
MPLDVDSGIELPQLELTHNFTGDCTTAYSTGGVRETAPQLTPQGGKGHCTTDYSTGGVRETAPQLTPQVG